MQYTLHSQLGRNVEAYVDDLVIKTRNQASLIDDLDETFRNLRRTCMMLNPEKCVFGVPAGKLLRFLVSSLGIEANPDKIRAIEEMRPPSWLKDVQCLTGCMAAWTVSFRGSERRSYLSSSFSRRPTGSNGTQR